TCRPESSTRVALSISARISATQLLNRDTESNSEARKFRSPSTGLGRSPMSVWKISSSEGAGSTEQTSTGVLDFCREQKPSAADIVVLPTPPFPTTNESCAPNAGHFAITGRISGFAFRFGIAGFPSRRLPENTCSANFCSSFAPAIGNPGSSATQNLAAGYFLRKNARAALAAAAFFLHKEQFPARPTTRLSMTAPNSE